LSASGITTSVVHRDEIAVLSVGGEIDTANAAALETAIGAVLTDSPAMLIIDLSAVEFLGSTGLRVLATTNEKVGSSIRLAVVASGPVTRRPIELTDLDQVLSLYPTLDDAVTSLRDDTP
jgi:anti-sigma B factor antagonist